MAADEEGVSSVHHLFRPRRLDPHQIAEVACIGGRHHPVFDTQPTASEERAINELKRVQCHTCNFPSLLNHTLQTTRPDKKLL